MNRSRNVRPGDFEELGFTTRLESQDRESAKEICALQIHGYQEFLEPRNTEIVSRLGDLKQRDRALHVRLYDRPIPVNDAAMLVRSKAVRTLAVLAVLTGIASLTGNVSLFVLFGFGATIAVLLALGATVVPLAVGHLAYERLVASSKMLQVALALVVVALCYTGIVEIGKSRRDVFNRAMAEDRTTTRSYVDQDSDDPPPDAVQRPPQDSEAKTHEKLGDGMFILLLAAEVAFGFLAGRLSKLLADEDYAAWQELRKTRKAVRDLERELAERIAAVETAKLSCMAGIHRAENVLKKRRPPYYKVLAMVILAVVTIITPRGLHAQAVDHYEGILIDTSGSIARGGSNELFREYLISTKRLLLTELPSSRVWVSVIATDSFGGVHEIVKGWTPEAHGVFTDDLDRARRQLAASFAAKSSGMAPVAAGTDIIGALWHIKALFESGPEDQAAGEPTKTIRIFSDMMNETASFPMPALVGMGPERMLERAKGEGLVVPLRGYRIYVQGAGWVDTRTELEPVLCRLAVLREWT